VCVCVCACVRACVCVCVVIFGILSNESETTFSCACFLIPFVPIFLFWPLSDFFVCLSVFCLFVIVINITCSVDQL